MADSSYYKKQYNSKKQEVKEYEDNLKDLEKILESINYNLPVEIFDVNDSIGALIQDLTRGIKENATFLNRANGLENRKEKSIEVDSNVSVTLNAIEDEIKRLTDLKSEAISARDDYHKKYKDKKAVEREALMNKIFGGD